MAARTPVRVVLGPERPALPRADSILRAGRRPRRDRAGPRTASLEAPAPDAASAVARPGVSSGAVRVAVSPGRRRRPDHPRPSGTGNRSGSSRSRRGVSGGEPPGWWRRPDPLRRARRRSGAAEHSRTPPGDSSGSAKRRSTTAGFPRPLRPCGRSPGEGAPGFGAFFPHACRKRRHPDETPILRRCSGPNSNAAGAFGEPVASSTLELQLGETESLHRPGSLRRGGPGRTVLLSPPAVGRGFAGAPGRPRQPDTRFRRPRVRRHGSEEPGGGPARYGNVRGHRNRPAGGRGAASGERGSDSIPAGARSPAATPTRRNAESRTSGRSSNSATTGRRSPASGARRRGGHGRTRPISSSPGDSCPTAAVSGRLPSLSARGGPDGVSGLVPVRGAGRTRRRGAGVTIPAPGAGPRGAVDERRIRFGKRRGAGGRWP